MGPLQEQRPQPADSRPRHRVEGGRRRQDQVDLQAAPRGEIPRRLRLQRRRRGLERQQGARQDRQAVRCEPGGRDRLAHAHTAQREENRRPDRGTGHVRAGLVPAVQHLEPVHGLAHAVGEEVRRRAGLGDRCGRTQQAGLGSLCRRRLRHRPVQDDPLRAARAPGAGQERQLLGQQARAQDRQGGDGADARGQRPHGRAAVGPGRLDRGPRA
ncbi:hypothetical protein D3C81_1170090 [compost metagenome]